MSERLMVEIVSRLRQEREEAFNRAGLFARHADRLEKALQAIMECPCCEQYSCAENANLMLSEACRLFNQEWSELHVAN